MASPKLSPLAGEKGGEESRKLSAFWHDQLKEIEDSVSYKQWFKRAEKVEERYRDERNRSQEFHTRRYNALWSNIQILQPALYGKCPVPLADRRFKDKDPIGRNAATILERGLRNEIEINSFHESVSRAVLDYLLPGRGTVWVRYEPIIDEGPSLEPTPETDLDDPTGSQFGTTAENDRDTDESGEENLEEKLEAESPEEEAAEGPEGELEEEEHEEKLISTGDRVLRESAPVDYLPWKDFYCFPVRARTWAEVTAVCKRVYMSREQLKRRFGSKIGNAIPFQRDQRTSVPKTEMAADYEEKRSDKGEVFEIWSKQDMKVYWIAEGYDYLCDVIDDPLELEGFFPTPRPLFANPTNSTLVPVPDYYQYQDQAIQIDELTQRLSMLTKACKVAGVYNAAAKDIQRLFDEGVDNQLLPVDDWAAFAEKGGVEGNISFIPLQEIKDVMLQLQQAKQVQIEEMDRLTGINDILRGTTDARETLGAQRLKTNNTGTRLSYRQDEVARFACDTIRIMADIMCKHFSPQSLIEVSGALYSEGLGPNDMPPLTALEGVPSAAPSPGQPGQPGQQPQQPQQPPPPPDQSQQGQPGQPQQPQQPQQPAPQTPPPPPPPPTQQGAQTGALPGPPGSGAGATGTNLPPPPPGMPQMPVPPEIQAKLQAVQRIIQAIQLLRDEKLLGFRVDIEVDSTIYGDSEQEKADRIEFLRATTDYFQQAMLISQQMPELTPLLGKFLQFGVRSFRIGRDLETAIEETVDQLPQLIQQRMQMGMQNPSPDLIRAQAAMIQAQSAAGKNQSQHQFEVLRAQADLASAQQQSQRDQAKAQAEVSRQAIENEGERTNQAIELAKTQAQAQHIQMQAASDQQQSEIDKQIKYIELQIKLMEMQEKRGQYQQDIFKTNAETQKTMASAQQTAHQVGVERFKSQGEAHKAQAVAHQAPIEGERTKQALINARAAQFKASQPVIPGNPNKNNEPE